MQKSILTLFHPIFFRLTFLFLSIFFLSKLNAQNTCLTWYDLRDKNLDFPVNNNSFLIEKGGGKVFQYSCDSLTRIDRSFSFKTRYGSLNFVYNNELYSFGGYGIFQFNNSLIRFYRPKGTWELVLPNTMENSPTPRRFMLGGIGNDKLYVGPGTTQKFDPTTKKVSDRIINDFWRYDFGAERWNQLITPDAVKELISEKSKFFNLGEHAYILGDDLVVYDFEKEEILVYKEYKSSIFHNAIKLEDEGDDMRVYYDKESVSLSKSSLLGPLTFKEKIQLSQGDNILQISLLFVLFILVLLALRKYYNMKSWKRSLNPHQLNIIKYIQENNNTSSFKDLYKLYPNSLSHETLKGKLRKDLESIDEQYYKIYHRKFFFYGVDPLDKRMKVISIN